MNINKADNLKMKIKSSKIFKIIAIALCFFMAFEQSGFAQVAGQLDISGRFAAFSSSLVQDKFRPLHLRYLQYDPQLNNFKLLLDKGNSKKLSNSFVEESTKTLLQYFLVGVSLPNDAFWVNLRPDSPDNVIDPLLGQTDVGKILLEADVQLKKDTAKFTSPETPEGKEYWDKLYEKAGEIFGSQNVTIPTLTRPWIVPDEIILRETSNNAYVYKATLKVMLEDDYLKGSAVYNFDDPRLKELNAYASSVLKEKIIPKLTQEVNASKKYASLRQVYYSLILAQWFKDRFSTKKGLTPQGSDPNSYSSLINSRNLTNLVSKGAWSKNTYFQQYQKSFKDGEYNFKVPMSTPYGQVIRSYFSGGANLSVPIGQPGTSRGSFTSIVGNRLRDLSGSVKNILLELIVKENGSVKMIDIGELDARLPPLTLIPTFSERKGRRPAVDQDTINRMLAKEREKILKQADEIDENAKQELSQLSHSQKDLIKKILGTIDISDAILLASVIAGGKPGTLILIEPQNKQFFESEEVQNLLKSLGLVCEIGSLYRNRGTADFFIFNHHNVFIYREKDAQKIIQENQKILEKEGLSSLKNTGKFINSLSDGYIGLFLGYPKDAVINFVEMSRGRVIENRPFIAESLRMIFRGTYINPYIQNQYLHPQEASYNPLYPFDQFMVTKNSLQDCLEYALRGRRGFNTTMEALGIEFKINENNHFSIIDSKDTQSEAKSIATQKTSAQPPTATPTGPADVNLDIGEHSKPISIEQNVSPFIQFLAENPETRVILRSLGINQLGLVNSGTKLGNGIVEGSLIESGVHNGTITYRMAVSLDAPASAVFHEILHAAWRNNPGIREYWRMKGWGNIKTRDRGQLSEELKVEEAFCDLFEWEMFVDGGIDAKVSVEVEGEHLTREARARKLKELQKFFQDVIDLHPNLKLLQLTELLKAKELNYLRSTAAQAGSSNIISGLQNEVGRLAGLPENQVVIALLEKHLSGFSELIEAVKAPFSNHEEKIARAIAVVKAINKLPISEKEKQVLRNILTQLGIIVISGGAVEEASIVDGKYRHRNKVDKSQFTLPSNFEAAGVNLVDALLETLRNQGIKHPLCSVIGSTVYTAKDGVIDWDIVDDIDIRIYTENYLTIYQLPAMIEDFFIKLKVPVPDNRRDILLDKEQFRIRTKDGKSYRVSLLFLEKHELSSYMEQGGANTYRIHDTFFGDKTALGVFNTELNNKKIDVLLATLKVYEDIWDETNEILNKLPGGPDDIDDLKPLKNLYQLAYMRGREREFTDLLDKYKAFKTTYDKNEEFNDEQKKFFITTCEEALDRLEISENDLRRELEELISSKPETLKRDDDKNDPTTIDGEHLSAGGAGIGRLRSDRDRIISEEELGNYDRGELVAINVISRRGTKNETKKIYLNLAEGKDIITIDELLNTLKNDPAVNFFYEPGNVLGPEVFNKENILVKQEDAQRGYSINLVFDKIGVWFGGNDYKLSSGENGIKVLDLLNEVKRDANKAGIKDVFIRINRLDGSKKVLVLRESKPGGEVKLILEDERGNSAKEGPIFNGDHVDILSFDKSPLDKLSGDVGESAAKETDKTAYNGEGGTEEIVHNDKYIETVFTQPLMTVGLATCCALAIIDRKNQQHFLAHVTSGAEGLFETLAGIGIDLNGKETEIYIMRGDGNTDKSHSIIVSALDNLGVKDKIIEQELKTKDVRLSGILLYKGNLYEPRIDNKGSLIYDDKRYGGGAEIGEKGGIDFRALPITTQPMLSAGAARINPGTINITNISLDKEWQAIENMLNAGIKPSLERIREYLILSCKDANCQAKIDQVLSGLADILRMEEEASFKTETELKAILMLLESNKSVEQLGRELLKISIIPQEPLRI